MLASPNVFSKKTRQVFLPDISCNLHNIRNLGSTLLQNSSNRLRILPPTFWKNRGSMRSTIWASPAAMQVKLLLLLQNFLNSLRMLPPTFLKKQNKYSCPIFRATSPPLEFWVLLLLQNSSNGARINYVCFWTWMSGEGPCHSGIGLVTLKLDLRPSFIFNDKLYLFLDLDVGRWGLRSSIGLVTLKLGLRPSFILNENL